MTVGENVFLGKEQRNGPAIDWNRLYADTDELLKRYKLPVESHQLVKHLGVGQMQMTEIAKALSEKAKILILDEPTSALSEAEVDKLMEILHTEDPRRHLHLHLPQARGVLPHHGHRDGAPRRQGVTTQPTKELTVGRWSASWSAAR